MNDAITIECPVRAGARRMPDAPAVVGPGYRASYRVLDRTVTATARQLEAAGGAPGSRVGVYVAGAWEGLIVLLAALRAGCTACLVSTRVPPAGVALLVRKVAAGLVVTDRPVPGLPGRMVRAAEFLVTEQGGDEEAAAQLRLDRPATVVFTSGSLGTPKAALHSVGNHVWSAEGSNANIVLEPGDRWALMLPLYHVGGMGVVFRCLLAGAAVVIPGQGEGVGEAIRRYGVTHVSLVATQLDRLLQAPDGLPASLKAVLVGGSAVPERLVREAYRRGMPVHTTYGLTEMTSQVTTTPPGASLDRLASSGRVLPHRRLHLAADGEILVQGATRFLGYVTGDGLETPFDADGWFHTRDLGILDADGYLHVRGRKDNLFISGGENIQPEEIEALLVQDAAVRRAVVVPVDDATFGQRPVVFLDGPTDERSVAAFVAALEARLPRFKIPVAFYAWPADADAGRHKPDRAFFRRRAEDLQRGSA